jgi:hypothetical protein
MPKRKAGERPPKAVDLPEVPKNHPDTASVEFIDHYGNTILIMWHPVTYYHVEHYTLGGISEDVPLSVRDRSPREMPKTYKWLLDQIKKAREVISSTVDEIPVTTPKRKGGKRKRKRRKRKTD